MEDKDKQLDQKLLSSFQQQPLRTAPPHLWARIADALPPAADKPATDPLLDNALQSAFLHQPSKKAPQQLWNKIQDKLPHTSNNQPLDEKVAASFRQKIASSAPERVWHLISKQLTIDKAWVRIARELDGWKKALFWKRFWRNTGLAAVLALLLWWRGCDSGLRFDTPTPAATPLPAQPTQDIGMIKQGLSTLPFTPSADAQIVLQPAADLQTSKQDRTTASLHQPTLSASVAQTKKQSRKQQRAAALLDSSLPPVADGHNAGAGRLHIATPLTTTTDHIGDEQWDEPALSNSSNQVAATDLIPADGAALPLTLPTLAADTLPEQYNEYVPETPAIAKTRKKGGVEVGMFFELGTQVLWNDETKESLKKSSLIQTRFLPSPAVGASVRWNANANHAVIAAFIPQSAVRQQYSFYEKGVYSNKTVKMNYLKMLLSYQYQFGGSRAGMGWVRIGAFAAHLQQRQEHHSNQKQHWVVDNTKLFRRWDGGLRLGLGYRYTFDRISLEIGLQAEAGLGNIFAGNAKVPAYFQRTHIIGLSGFIGAGYRF